jgi:hypothetical protein
VAMMWGVGIFFLADFHDITRFDVVKQMPMKQKKKILLRDIA